MTLLHGVLAIIMVAVGVRYTLQLLSIIMVLVDVRYTLQLHWVGIT